MKMNQKGNDYFETPDYIFNQLNDIFNFQFDVACSPLNCKVKNERVPDNFDGLAVSWKNARCLCNPPFSQKAEWIKKADYEVKNGCPICVMILPLNCMDTKIFHEIIEGRYHYEILKGRIAFINPETKKAQKGNNSGTVIVYFKKKVEV